MLGIGHYTATIVENSVKTSGTGSTYISLLLQIDEDMTDCKIYLTDKTINKRVAQKQLAKCGFDYDRDSLSLLSDNPKLLEGIKVPVVLEENEYRGQVRLQCNIDIESVKPASKEDMSKLQELLRAKKVEKDKITDEDIPF
jgi:hypothetical protein